jgi:hypothetical protein
VADELVLVESLPLGSLVLRPKGHVQHVVVSFLAFHNVCGAMSTRPSVKWYPTSDGGFSRLPSPHATHVDPYQLRFTLKYHRRRFEPQQVLLFSLSSGRFEFMFKGCSVRLVQRGSSSEVKVWPRTVSQWISSDGKVYLRIKYPISSWSKGSAWLDLVKNPPVELPRGPGTSREDNPYRAHHTQEEFCWMTPLPQSRFALI